MPGQVGPAVLLFLVNPLMSHYDSIIYVFIEMNNIGNIEKECNIVYAFPIDILGFDIYFL